MDTTVELDNRDDWFTVSIGPNATATVTATFDHGEGDIDLTVFRPDFAGNPGSSILPSGISSTSNETVVVTNEDDVPGLFPVLVHRSSTNGLACQPYSIGIQ